MVIVGMGKVYISEAEDIWLNYVNVVQEELIKP